MSKKQCCCYDDKTSAKFDVKDGTITITNGTTTWTAEANGDLTKITDGKKETFSDCFCLNLLGRIWQPFADRQAKIANVDSTS